ncbi:hypothetical protein BgiBS90_038145 [Biomphalaria glabrata]|nr:hypothetical protein BgiBS90_038145 [Biomphalaria glabrata]
MAASGQSRGHVRLRVGLLKAIAYSQGHADCPSLALPESLTNCEPAGVMGFPPVLRVAHWTVADSQSHPSRKGWHVSVVLSTGCAVVLLSLSMLLASSVISHRRAGPARMVICTYGRCGPSRALLSKVWRWGHMAVLRIGACGRPPLY